jgi:antitoxin Phd
MAKAWKLEDAKARFSELVRSAQQSGPQHVTVRGREAAVVLSPEDFRRLTRNAEQDRPPLVPFLEGLGLDDLDLSRDRDTGRDPML